MEYNHLQEIPIMALRNRLLLLHHISELFCPCIPMFDLEGRLGQTGHGPSLGFDTLRGILISQGKVGTPGAQSHRCTYRTQAAVFLSGVCVGVFKQEAAFRKVVQATMVRDRQHGPVVELNRIQVLLEAQSIIYQHNRSLSHGVKRGQAPDSNTNAANTMFYHSLVLIQSTVHTKEVMLADTVLTLAQAPTGGQNGVLSLIIHSGCHDYRQKQSPAVGRLSKSKIK